MISTATRTLELERPDLRALDLDGILRDNLRSTGNPTSGKDSDESSDSSSRESGSNIDATDSGEPKTSKRLICIDDF